MEMKKGRLVLTIAGIIALSMVLTASSALALDPPPPGTKIWGGPITVDFVFTESATCFPPSGCPDDGKGIVSEVVSGRCKGVDFSEPPSEGLCEFECYGELDESLFVEGEFFADPYGELIGLPTKCLPKEGVYVEGWVIHKLLSYYHDIENGEKIVSLKIKLVIVR